MGQSQEAALKSALLPQPTVRYEVDAHLLQYETVLPSSFSFAIQKLIGEVEAFCAQIEEHPIEPYLVHAVDERFRAVEVDAEVFHAGQDSPNWIRPVTPAAWSELGSKEAFLRLVQRLQRNYHIESSIEEEFRRQLAALDKRPALRPGGFESLRKEGLPELPAGSELDLGLVMRLVFSFYLRMLKLNANQAGRQVVQFHSQTGRMLCLLIFHGYLSTEELFELLYHLVCVDKGAEGVLQQKLQLFHRRFHGLCLKHAHSIGLPRERLQAVQTTARLYLDELYLKSLEEAEDPEIKSSDDVLLPIKMFPISRVKDKQRA